MRWKNVRASAVLTAVLAGAIAVGAGGAAAEPVKPNLSDVRVESPWALGSVAEMVQRGVFTGYEDGTFKPRQAMTRIEAVVTAVRQAGYEAEAKSDRYVSKRLKAADAKLIEEEYGWAVGYVAVAEEKRLMPEATIKALRPGNPAERWWTTALLLNAFGMQAEAKKLEEEELPFKDAEDIPEAGIGYAALAAERGIVTGYEDDTFRPNASITRAEIAVVLDRIGDQLPAAGDTTYVQLAAVVSGTGAGELVVTKDGVTQPFRLAVDATTVREQELISLRGLVAGDKVTAVIRRSDNMIVHVTVTETAKAKPQPEPKPSEVTGNGTESTGTEPQSSTSDTMVPPNGRIVGKVADVTADMVTVTADDGTVYRYPLSQDATVVVNQIASSRSDIRVGDHVDAVVFEGSIFHARVTTIRPAQGEATGYITAMYNQQLEIGLDGRTTLYNVKPDADIYRGGKVAELTDLVIGDYVKVFLDNGMIWILTVMEEAKEEGNHYTFEGTYVNHINDHTGKMYEITVKGELKGNPITRTFTLDSDAFVLVDGKPDSPVYAGRSTPVKLLVIEGKVKLVEIGE